MSNLKYIVNVEGIPFTVRLNRDNPDYLKPLVEFYDSRWNNFKSIGDKHLGQFVSSYYPETFNAIRGQGLLLDSGSDDWRISRENVEAVQAWLAQEMESINA